MIRLTLAAAMFVGFAAAPVAASTEQQAPQAAPAPGSEAALRLKGETNRQAPDSKQIPAELEETARLNAEIAARNAAAAEAETEARTSHEAAQARWAEDNARYEAERARWESEMAACRAAGGTCTTTAPSPGS